MEIKYKGVVHKKVKLSNCGKYYIASNNFTKFKKNKVIEL